MALPPGFLDELRARVPISQIVGRRVTWDSRKSNPARGDMWACCPFHDEKSPSFHVDDRKGFYHCFGCGAKGDAIGFLRERENMGFMDAVAELAREAGMAMPAQDPAAAARAEKARGLADWMEEAARYFRDRLMAPEGQTARRYLAGRGLSAQTIERFGLGFATADRQGLLNHLKGKGASDEIMAEAGLIGIPEGGGRGYDRFRERIIFPIRDARGRCIAFGGRAVRDGQEPKYLNSPETPLFDKSRTLFNIGPARAAAGRAGVLLVVEGYMDVIALVQGGFEHAVAPLGTALTEHHLAMLWRLCPEPVLALDGDGAGLRAAHRAIDLALPQLGAERSLRIALLPKDQDPDDLIRRGGRAAVETVIAEAEPPVALLWRRETEGKTFDSPERRAALDASLRKLLARIADPALRGHYRAALAERRANLMGMQRERPQHQSGRRWSPRGPMAPLPTASSGTRRSALGRGDGAPDPARGREAAILLTLLHHPGLLDRHGDALAELEFTQADFDAIRHALLSAWATAPSAEAVQLWIDANMAQTIATLSGAPQVASLGFTGRGASSQDAEQGLSEALARQAASATLSREIAEAVEALREDGEPGSTLDGRLRSAAQSAERLLGGTISERTDDDNALAEALRDAISNQIWVKRRR